MTTKGISNMFFKKQHHKQESEQKQKQIEELKAQNEKLQKEYDRLLEQYNTNTILLEQFRGMIEDRIKQNEKG